MAITPLGSAAMSALLSGRGRVTLVNRTSAAADVVIIAAAIARHTNGAAAHIDTTFALEIAADQSVGIEAAPPLAETPEAIEVALRLRIRDEAVVDAYAIAHRAATDTLGGAEFGIKDNDGVLADGEDSVPGFPEIAIYASSAQ